MLGLAVAATLAANIGYGLPFGVTGALLSGWPAVAFVGSAEMAIGMVRRVRVATERPADTDVATVRTYARPKRWPAGGQHGGRCLAWPMTGASPMRNWPGHRGV